MVPVDGDGWAGHIKKMEVSAVMFKPRWNQFFMMRKVHSRKR
jgi:hypothetical protein